MFALNRVHSLTHALTNTRGAHRRTRAHAHCGSWPSRAQPLEATHLATPRHVRTDTIRKEIDEDGFLLVQVTAQEVAHEGPGLRQLTSGTQRDQTHPHSSE